MDFAIDSKAFWILCFLCLLFYLLHRWAKRSPHPILYFPDLAGLAPIATSWRLPFARLPHYLLYGGLICFAAAFTNPRILIPRPGGDTGQPSSEPVQGIAIYLLLDNSVSMADSVTISTAEGRETIPKIELLKKLSAAFVQGDPTLNLAGRPNDMIGIVALARGATVLSPLTLDHKAIVDKIKALNVVPKTPEQGGTVIGYGIFKTANLIAATRHFAEELIQKKQPAYTIKNSVIILLTDGFQDPNPLDEKKELRVMEVPDAAEYARQAGVKVYIVNLDPAIGTEEFAAVRDQMKRAAESTGGRYYLVQGTTGLAQIYSEIDRLEKSALPTLAEAIPKEQQPQRYRAIPLFALLLTAGIILLSLSCLLDTTLLRRVP